MLTMQTDLHTLTAFRLRPQSGGAPPLPARKVICCSASAGTNSARFDSSWHFSGASFVQQGMSPGIEHPDPRNGGGAASLVADGHVEKLDVKSMDRATRQRYLVLDP